MPHCGVFFSYFYLPSSCEGSWQSRIRTSRGKIIDDVMATPLCFYKIINNNGMIITSLDTPPVTEDTYLYVSKICTI